MLTFILNAFFVACISYTYHAVLRDKLLSGWFLWGFNKFGNKNNWTYYFYEPIFNCEKCFAGQLALWGFPFLFNYNLFYHAAFIALSIVFTTLLFHGKTTDY